MNIGEEVFFFKHVLGAAIAQWGYVENQLLRIARRCVQDSSALTIAYYSVENFRSKLAMCDNLVLHRFGKSPHLSKWRTAYKRTTDLSAKRNKIAHGSHYLYVHSGAGKRWAIVPLHHENGELFNTEGKTPPKGAICLRDLVGIQMEFHSLTTQLCNVYELLAGRPAPFPESHEQEASPPTIRAIENQMRAKLGRQPRPSRNKSSPKASP